eukprot:12935957-Prorocentrum_lima.AAC.1
MYDKPPCANNWRSTPEGQDGITRRIGTTLQAGAHSKDRAGKFGTLHVDVTSPFETTGEKGYRYLLIMAQS